MLYKFNDNKNTATNNFDYTFDLTKYFNNSNKKKDYTSTILDKIRSIFPWANNNSDDITITIDSIPTSYTLLNVTSDALNAEWNKAASRLYDYIYYSEHPSYDFKIGGVPVKIHGNYIQVGSEIIPKFTTSKFFDKMTKKNRIILYNISLSINSIEIAA